MPRFKDQAVCIRHIDWSETSQVVALMTREHGKLRGLAKGSRRTSPGAIARFCGGIDLLTRGEVIAATRPASDLAAITEWDLQDSFHHLRTDLQAHRLGMYGADLVASLLMDHDPHPRVFDALVRFIESLRVEEAGNAQADDADRQMATALLRFQWNVLADCGFKPELDRDVVTGQPIGSSGGHLLFDPRAGGVTMEAGATANGQSISAAGPWRVRGETIDLLRRLGDDPGDDLVDADPGDPGDPGADVQRLRRANRLLCVFTRTVIDRELPTMRFVLE